MGDNNDMRQIILTEKKLQTNIYEKNCFEFICILFVILKIWSVLKLILQILKAKFPTNNDKKENLTFKKIFGKR